MIEDNPLILRTNRAQLELEEYRVLATGTLAEGMALAEKERPDLILLDILLPDGNGLTYCREMLGQNGPRILFLSALDTPQDVVAGLRAGGDDYITKPYLMDELLARIEALLRRKSREDAPVRIGALELNALAGRALLNGRDLLLTPKEFALLEILLRRAPQYIPSRELYEAVWGMRSVDIRTVRQHIRRIREKLGGDAPVRIESEQGKGYRLVEAGFKG